MVGRRQPMPLLGVLLGSLVMAACGDSPTSPGPPSPPTPPVVGAPAITSISSSATRSEVDTNVSFSAVVAPGEGPGALTYQWSASIGTITGVGSTATWRLAKGTAQTPANVVVTLTVVKPYQALENGQLVTREYRITHQAPAVRVHDSPAETSAMALRFLTELFADSSLSADQCLVDFWPDCRGTEEERGDIEKNRRERLITSVEAEVDRVTLNGELTAGEVRADCTFRDIERATSKPDAVTGTCRLDVVYHEGRWWLCSSTFTDIRPAAAAPTALAARPISAYWRRGGR